MFTQRDIKLGEKRRNTRVYWIGDIPIKLECHGVAQKGRLTDTWDCQAMYRNAPFTGFGFESRKWSDSKFLEALNKDFQERGRYRLIDFVFTLQE